MISFTMFKTVILLSLATVAFATDEPVGNLIPTPTYPFNQDYYRNQQYQNQFDPYNPYTGNNFYQPNNYRYNQPNNYRNNQPGYFNRDYQKYNTGNYYNQDYPNNNYNNDYYNKNYHNNEYYQKYNQDGKSAGILRSVSNIQPDGSYQYGFETQNGIVVEQQGLVRAAADQTAPVVVQGFYRYTSPEGVPVEVKYTADEFGYHPQGSVIPGQGQAFTYKTAAVPAAEK